VSGIPCASVMSGRLQFLVWSFECEVSVAADQCSIKIPTVCDSHLGWIGCTFKGETLPHLSIRISNQSNKN